MRNLRPWLMLLLALASGGLAAYLALRYLKQQASPLMAAEPRRGKVALATRDLPLGTMIAEPDVKMVEWPGEAMPVGYVGSVEGAIGRGVIVPVRLNEPLMDNKLATKEAGGGLPIAVGEGMRAVSVRVNEVVSVAGFVVPGTRVDVLLTLSNAPGTSETTTKVILQNVQTLAAGQQIQKDKDGKPISVTVMTFLLTPEQAETLTLASSQGQIQLALRNTLDTLTAKTEGAVVSGLLGKTKKAAPTARANRGPRAPVQAPAATIIEGYNGGVRTLLKF